MRLDELQSHCRVVTAECTARAPMVGSTLDVTEYPRERENGTYFIEAAAFELADGEYIARAESGGEDLPSFAARYTLIPVETAYRPPRVTPWPVMRGPQTAVVLGPADRHNEEIHTDQYSRVKVKFHWVNGNKTLTVNKDDKTTVKGMQDVSLTKDGTYMAEGKVFWHSDGGSVFRSKDSVKIESEKDIEIVVGQARLMMKKDGTISINGKDITLDASGAGTFKADKDVKIKGKNVNHN